jgi:hypothetical protein
VYPSRCVSGWLLAPLMVGDGNKKQKCVTKISSDLVRVSHASCTRHLRHSESAIDYSLLRVCSIRIQSCMDWLTIESFLTHIIIYCPRVTFS